VCTGARLTAFELVHDGLPATLICDSAAAALMAQGQVRSAARVQRCTSRCTNAACTAALL
jgi:methylthioribose-1-phosphate isomerase